MKAFLSYTKQSTDKGRNNKKKLVTDMSVTKKYIFFKTVKDSE